MCGAVAVAEDLAARESQQSGAHLNASGMKAVLVLVQLAVLLIIAVRAVAHGLPLWKLPQHHCPPLIRAVSLEGREGGGATHHHGQEEDKEDEALLAKERMLLPA